MNNKWALRAGQLTLETRPFIGGEYVKPLSKEVFHTENPANINWLAEFPDCGVEDVDAAVAAARAAFRGEWHYLSPDRRKVVLLAFADEILKNREELALLDCIEMGMPISMALANVGVAADYIQYYGELADKIYGEIAPTDQANTLAMTQLEPRGVVGVISPWNYPLLTAVLAIGPALAAGNAVISKPSEQAPSSALKLAEIAMKAGLPAGTLNVVPGCGVSAGTALAKHMDVDKMHFTGSTATGRQLMVYSGQSNGKPVMLEAGGKSPQIVFGDAVDIEGLGAALAHSAFTNTGQLCVARTRLLVHESVKDQVIELVRAATKETFTTGDTFDESVNFGPLSSRKQYERVTGFMEVGENDGADLQMLETSGQVPESGFYIPPSMFASARNDMRVAQEEIFGPVMAIISFKTEAEAIALANGVCYGLAATAWTRDIGRARRLARDLEAGRVEIRATTAPGAGLTTLSAEPFGNSGHGVLGGIRGLEPYIRLKGVQIITD